jgi:hypothetical protein
MGALGYASGVSAPLPYAEMRSGALKSVPSSVPSELRRVRSANSRAEQGWQRHGGYPHGGACLVGTPSREGVLQLQRLGTRAVVAEALVAEAEKVDRAVRHLVDAAAGGDIAAAKALIPWLNQALGMPQERVQHTTPSTLEELERMDKGELDELVARGRQRRLRALRVVPDAPDWRARGALPETN